MSAESGRSGQGDWAVDCAAGASGSMDLVWGGGSGGSSWFRIVEVGRILRTARVLHLTVAVVISLATRGLSQH
jgi:hypothetical protein